MDSEEANRILREVRDGDDVRKPKAEAHLSLDMGKETLPLVFPSDTDKGAELPLDTDMEEAPLLAEEVLQADQLDVY